MNCPACSSNTVEQGFEGSRGAKVLLDVCPSCHGLWFDLKESLQLSSSGVLQIFRQMHGQKDGHHRLKEPLPCPRCKASLVRTQDLARGNRFQYFRCPQTHGHFITFFQFLREKGIVRGLNPKELGELKKHIQHLQCSDCGDPISLQTDSACPRCKAPLCILDPKALGSAIEGLKPAAMVAGAVVAPAVAAQILMEQMKLDGFFRKLDSQVQAASSSAGTVPVIDSSSSSGLDSAMDALDVAEAGSDLVDLLDVGVDLFFEIASGIGDLF